MLVGVAALLASPASATARDIGPDDEVVITGTVDVARGEFVDRIVIGDGRVDIEGHVEGIVLALDAPVHIGRHAVVDGDVVAGARPVTLEPGATLNQDLIYLDDKPVVPRGVTIYGEVRRVGTEDFGSSGRVPGACGALAGFHAVVARARARAAVARAGRGASGLRGRARTRRAGDRVGPRPLRRPAGGRARGPADTGGDPARAVVLLALFPLYALGYVASAYVLGRAILSDSRGRVAAFLAGWGILRAVAFIPGLGVLAWLGATVFGLGVLTVALWRARGPAEPQPRTA